MCQIQHQSDKLSNRTLKDVIGNRLGTPNAYVHVRQGARTAMKRSGITKKCYICSYDKHVEVCHRRPIHEFSLFILVKEINSLSNLVYLCPNCHWEFDHGMLDLNSSMK
jgi:predicted HNH restriction endonuclease